MSWRVQGQWEFPSNTDRQISKQINKTSYVINIWIILIGGVSCILWAGWWERKLGLYGFIILTFWNVLMFFIWVVVENWYGENPAKKKKPFLLHYQTAAKPGCRFPGRRCDRWLLFLVRSQLFNAIGPSCYNLLTFCIALLIFYAV